MCRSRFVKGRTLESGVVASADSKAVCAPLKLGASLEVSMNQRPDCVVFFRLAQLSTSQTPVDLRRDDTLAAKAVLTSIHQLIK